MLFENDTNLFCKTITSKETVVYLKTTFYMFEKSLEKVTFKRDFCPV